ncbi:uncharacterized protein LOC113467825 [Diaphorina citri]|uniref:Uncharacterized protein LOC113467825 n=1 Tax=Diaphorina citri TaxID=121845 RepID=A0A3Q0IUY6_DIACI|nr:uncharacterized protein LOC113467825 [Diaphorina citri]
MDATAKSDKTKHSLNELLYRGPVLLENLCSLLIRFRLYKYGVVSDIEKAFLNVGLSKIDRDSTRVIWLKDVEKGFQTGKSTTFQNLVQFWKKGNAHLNTFWKHWYNQYVMSLRESKRTGFKQGKVCSIEPRVGEFVLIKEEKLPRARWPYGVIRSLKYSQDGKVRSVELELPNNRFVIRPLRIIVPLRI